MLLKGGDTDTNAAIVGGMMGALHGVTELPQEWVHTMLNFRCQT
jgi:ADP-ribosyl-[dinitrogen reductase] hydrolase